MTSTGLLYKQQLYHGWKESTQKNMEGRRRPTTTWRNNNRQNRKFFLCCVCMWLIHISLCAAVCVCVNIKFLRCMKISFKMCMYKEKLYIFFQKYIWAALCVCAPGTRDCKKKRSIEEKCFATIGKHYFAQSMHNHRICWLYAIHFIWLH